MKKGKVRIDPALTNYNLKPIIRYSHSSSSINSTIMTIKSNTAGIESYRLNDEGNVEKIRRYFEGRCYACHHQNVPDDEIKEL